MPGLFMKEIEPFPLGNQSALQSGGHGENFRRREKIHSRDHALGMNGNTDISDIQSDYLTFLLHELE